MTKNDFRLGNLILIPNIESKVLIPCIVSKIQGITIFGEIEVLHTPEHNGLSINNKHVSVIDITENWLKKAGFRLNYDRWHFPSDSYFEISLIDSEYVLTINEGEYETNTKVKYVHQLQNLHFALTGEELFFSTTEP